MDNQITILLAEDHEIVREGLRTLLETEGDIKVVAEAENGREAIRLVKEVRPAVAIIDIAMPTLNGLEVARRIKKAVPSTKILIFSAYSDQEYVEQAIILGASGYVLKTNPVHVLATAIREVNKGEIFFDPYIKKHLGDQYQKLADMAKLPDRKKHKLSSREIEVLQLIAEGKSNKDISLDLSISVKTVEKHRQHIMEKLNVHNTADLTRYAVSKGLVESSFRVKAQ